MRKSKKDILESIELRQSTIKDWLFCPRMFQMKHIEKIEQTRRHAAALHGSTLHKIIEVMHKGYWDLDIRSAYLEIFEMLEAESDVPVYFKEDLSRMVENAIEIIEGYRNNPINRECEILYIEQKFRVKIAGHWFTGTIDQVRKNPDGTIELLDLKSNKQRPSIAYLQNDWQLNLYTYALKHGELKVDGRWIKPNIMPIYSSWYFLRAHEIAKRTTAKQQAGHQKGEPLIRTEKGIEDMRRLREDMKSLLNAMLKDWSFPNPNSCIMCSYQQACADNDPITKDIAEEAKKILESSMNNLILVDDQDLYWVRKKSADCLGFELEDQIKRFQSNKHEIVLGYVVHRQPKDLMDSVPISLYSVYTTDINSHKYYSQDPNWEKTPWIAPNEAVNWAKEKKLFDIIE